MTDLSSRALLVSLTVSQWSARKYDRQETAAVLAKHAITVEAARVNKNLLPLADSLEKIHSKTNKLRWDYYNHSLPWGLQGVQIIHAMGYMDFVSMMRDHMFEWRQLVSDFICQYPQLKAEAQRTLNGLYRDEDYPSQEDLRHKFHCDIQFQPVPSRKDWRVSLMDDEMDELKRNLSLHLAKAETAAMQEAWKRVHELVVDIKDRLSQPDAVFRSALIENAVKLCNVLPMLNIAEDPNLEKIRRELERTLCPHDVETLRHAPDVREDVANQLKALEAKMGAFYAPQA